MSVGNAWLTDMRMKDIRDRFSRDGFPITRSCRLRRYRNFTLKAAVMAFLALLAYEVLQTGSQASAPVEKHEPIIQKLSRIKHLKYNEGMKHRAVVILTNHRSGSTFFSQLFNQRPDVFYMFEPLFPFGNGCSDEDEKVKGDYLHKLVKCNIVDQTELPQNHQGSEKQSDLRTRELCVDNNFCFRDKVKRLCGSDFCPERPDTCRKCGRVSSEQARSMCSTSQLTVVKVIRLCKLNTLKPLLEDDSLDLKILHLVRDPRGVFSSRMDLAMNWAYESINDTCSNMDEALKVSLNPGNTWLAGKYKLVRYEDVCQKPLSVAREVYDFVGLRMTSIMEKWIVSNTEGSISNLGDVRAARVSRKLVRHRYDPRLVRQSIVQDPYTTTRNSSAVWRKWRDKLDFDSVRSIQDDCQDVMRKLSYKPLREKWQLAEEEFPVLGSLCLKQTLPRCRVLDLVINQP